MILTPVSLVFWGGLFPEVGMLDKVKFFMLYLGLALAPKSANFGVSNGHK